jgi:hypothetical protein
MPRVGVVGSQAITPASAGRNQLGARECRRRNVPRLATKMGRVFCCCSFSISGVRFFFLVIFFSWWVEEQSNFCRGFEKSGRPYDETGAIAQT